MPDLDPDTLARLRTEFSRFDADDNGAIDPGEFIALMDAIGAGLSEAECLRAFSDIDKDESGRIEFEEFARWWRFRG